MEGKFLRKRSSVLWGWVCIVCSAVLALLFAFLLFADPQATPDDLLFLLFISLLGLLTGLSLLLPTRGAHLTVGENTLDLQQLGRKRLIVELSDITSVGLINGTTLCFMRRNGRPRTVSGLVNASEVCFYIQNRLTATPVDRDTQLADFQAQARARRRYLRIVILLLFVFIACLVLLLVLSEDSPDFTDHDMRLLSILGPIILVDLFFTFLAAQKARVSLIYVQDSAFRLRRALILTTPLPLSGTVRVLSDEAFTVRVSIIVLPHSTSAYYAVERFDNAMTLRVDYQSDIVESVEALPDDLYGLHEITVVS